MKQNENGINKNLLPLLHQPRKPHKTRRHRTANAKTNERKRTRNCAWARTKHDLPQPQAASPMQSNPCQTRRQKTHLHRQPRNPEPHLCCNRKSLRKILPHRRKMPKRRNLKMIKRKIVNINEKLCNGCGNCIPKCAEGALQIVNGKAKMIKEVYCDGLGACLGQCPQGAITITEREAEPFNETETHEHLKRIAANLTLANQTPQKPQWPVKLNLVPIKAPFFENANTYLPQTAHQSRSKTSTT